MSDETIDRTRLPIRRPPFAGVANQTLGGSEPDWEEIGHVKPPGGAPNVAIDWLHGVRGHDSEKPWMLYYSTGCGHSPHHVWKEWSEKYKGRFDQGWDKLREETFERQKQLGVVPADAVLTPRDESMPAWDSLDENRRRVCARQMEVYAGYSENADHHVGRLLDAIEAMGELDDTIVIWIWGDNGASLEGTPSGHV